MRNKDNEKVVILIPSFEPDQILLSYINQLITHDFHHIIVVDDGSSPKYQVIFNQLKTYGCTVLHHPKNLGKGCALKTGLHYIKKHYRSLFTIITVDADGQHAIEDVIRMSAFSKEHPYSLTLGTRHFRISHTPFKSLIGNKFASFIFYLLYGKYLTDTQTGLRAFNISLLDFMLDVEGDRFEYEIQMLIACIQANIPICTLPIRVIYKDANKGTHFKPFCDSLRIINTLLTHII